LWWPALGAAWVAGWRHRCGCGLAANPSFAESGEQRTPNENEVEGNRGILGIFVDGS
jgi:hypothetical protein